MSDKDSVDARLAEIEQREQAATRGPWKPDERYIVGGEDIPGSRPGGEVIAEAQPSMSRWPEYTIQMRRANAEFIAHARADVPWMSSQLRALLAENERLQGDVRRQTERADAVELIESRGRGLAQERADHAEAALAAVRELINEIAGQADYQIASDETAVNAVRVVAERFRAALAAAEQDEPKRCEHGFSFPHVIDRYIGLACPGPVSQPTKGSGQ